MNRLLILRGGALGDFLVTLPVLQALRRHFPAAAIEILGYPAFATLALEAGLADAIHPIESRRFTPLFSPVTSLPEELRQYLGAFDVFLSYLHDPSERVASHLQPFKRARLIQGPHRPAEPGTEHATEALLRPLEALGIRGVDSVPRLQFTGEDQNPLPPGRWLAAHPGSGSPRKNWPEARWTALLESLARHTDLKLLLIGGEAEAGCVERCAARLPPDRHRTLIEQPLVTVARQLRGCQAYLGHDSGITHLAAALGLGGLVLWGPTPESVWRPRGGCLELVRAPGGLSTLDVEEVRQRLEAWFPSGHRAAGLREGCR